MSLPAIRMIDVRKEFRSGFWMRKFCALSGLTLDVNRGESFGFVGPNGAGKTTTIKILAGLHAATSGTAEILGVPANDPKARFSLGFLPERPYFYTHVTARELLRFYGKLFELPAQELNFRIEELLERTNMRHVGDDPLGKYSKGMLQRIGLCQTMLHDPELLILDEPMSGLDPVGRALVRDIITEEQAKGKTVFFSSHVLSDVETICDRIAIIVGGVLRGKGTIDEIVGDKDVFVDCQVQMLSGQLNMGEVIKTQGDIQVIRISRSEVDQFIEQVRNKGGTVRALNPVRRTLEEVLIDEIQSQNATSLGAS